MRRSLPLLLAGCSFTVTNDPLGYEELSGTQQSAVDRIDGNIVALDRALLAQGGPGVCDGLRDPPIRCSRLRTEVGFEDILIAVNLGDGRARVSVWDDLTAAQHALVQSWWQVDPVAAEALYPGLAYDYMALHLAALEYVYVVQGVERVFEQRPRLNVERDANRIVAAYLRATWPGLLENMMALCQPMRAQYDAVWGDHYGGDEEQQRANQTWFQENLPELADPAHPTGYYYFLCRWTDEAYGRTFSLAAEMQKIKDRFGDP